MSIVPNAVTTGNDLNRTIVVGVVVAIGVAIRIGVHHTLTESDTSDE